MVEIKVALVTGAASGIGEACVQRFSENSTYSRIYAADINPGVHLRFPFSEYPMVVPVQIDLRRERLIDEMFGEIDASAGRLDVVVNAAGVIIAGRRRHAYQYFSTELGAQQMMNLHLTNEHGVYWINERAEEIMRRDGGGVLINITSSKDYFPDPFRQQYQKSKQRLERTCLANADRLARDNIRVVVVKPGNTKTNIDHGAWVTSSDPNEAQKVQGLNNWCRETFGNDPTNVADVISKIAEGEIQDRIVHVGRDANLGYLLTKTVPFWRQIFYLGAASVYKAAEISQSFRNIDVELGTNQTPNTDWYDEIVAECDCVPVLPPFFTSLK